METSTDSWQKFLPRHKTKSELLSDSYRLMEKIVEDIHLRSLLTTRKIIESCDHVDLIQKYTGLIKEKEDEVVSELHLSSISPEFSLTINDISRVITPIHEAHTKILDECRAESTSRG